MASERLVTQAKSALWRHYHTRPPQASTLNGKLGGSTSNHDDDEALRHMGCVWAHEFVQLLVSLVIQADYDFTVGGSSRRDEDVRAWVGQVEESSRETREGGSGLGSAGSCGNGHGNEVQDPVPSSDPAAALSLVHVGSNDSEISVEDGWEDMNRYMAVPHWDYLVDRIHRVERSEVTGEIMVYFTSRHGEKIKETGRLCKARLPKKLLAFYEENLRWDNNVVNGHY